MDRHLPLPQCRLLSYQGYQAPQHTRSRRRLRRPSPLATRRGGSGCGATPPAPAHRRGLLTWTWQRGRARRRGELLWPLCWQSGE